MAISLSITKYSTDESKEIPVATASSFRTYWEPAAQELQLEMIQALGGLWITPRFRDRFLGELGQLKIWVLARVNDSPYFPEMISRIDEIIVAIQSHPLEEYEISFG
jgi:hypothetical protein